MPVPSPHLSLRIAAAVAMIFGAVTVLAGGLALFGTPDMGDVVPFVLWFNFLAGFAYVLAGLGLWQARPWGVWLSIAILAATVVVFAALAFHALTGGAYEMRTVGALILRIGLWAAISLAGHRAMPR
ncbi:hypothetical protein C2I36_09800 [Rhodobacteraceae bacterium WD3A24]|nr:hypothetical protein C2I36_09800 [Rhodobacteraceae bacterium WD3A24]